MKKKHQISKAGYSMVEITLALLVAGVGIMGAFALFPEGLKAGREAVDVTECSAFVNAVFANLEFQSGDINTRWADLGAISEETHALKLDPQELISKGTNIYYWIPNYYEGDIYYKTAVFTYSLEVEQSPFSANLKYARLEVWPGEVKEFVGTPGYPAGKVFYREFTTIK